MKVRAHIGNQPVSYLDHRTVVVEVNHLHNIPETIAEESILNCYHQLIPFANLHLVNQEDF